MLCLSFFCGGGGAVYDASNIESIGPEGDGRWSNMVRTLDDVWFDVFL